jgi:hypothetical protein
MAVVSYASRAEPGPLAWALATAIAEGGAFLIASQLGAGGAGRRIIRAGAVAAIPPLARWLADAFGI